MARCRILKHVQVVSRDFGAVAIQVCSGQYRCVARMQIHLEEPEGVILAFLTGQDEIEHARHALEDAVPAPEQHPLGLGLSVVPIYAALPPDEQSAAFVPTSKGTRKVVLATNIAETSVTIPGVRFVVDSGMVKARAYSAPRGIESLQV
jgi:ATP-dependent RNA helicase DHX8/PRP22